MAEYTDGVSAIHEMSLDHSSSHDTLFDGSIVSGDFGMLFSVSRDAETIGLIDNRSTNRRRCGRENQKGGNRLLIEMMACILHGASL